MAGRKRSLVEDEILDNEVEETVVEEKVEQLKKKVFSASDGIMCRSIIQGQLFIDGIKTGILYTFTEYNDESEIEYRDLVAMIRSKSHYIYDPYIIILDEDFIKEFPQLEKFYAEQYTVRDLRDILKLPVNEMTKAIKSLPQGAVESLKNIASTQIADGKLDSVKKIKALDELFGTDLNLLSQLFDND